MKQDIHSAIQKLKANPYFQQYMDHVNMDKDTYNRKLWNRYVTDPNYNHLGTENTYKTQRYYLVMQQLKRKLHKHLENHLRPVEYNGIIFTYYWSIKLPEKPFYDIEISLRIAKQYEMQFQYVLLNAVQGEKHMNLPYSSYLTKYSERIATLILKNLFFPEGYYFDRQLELAFNNRYADKSKVLTIEQCYVSSRYDKKSFDNRIGYDMISTVKHIEKRYNLTIQDKTSLIDLNNLFDAVNKYGKQEEMNTVRKFTTPSYSDLQNDGDVDELHSNFIGFIEENNPSGYLYV